jgi:quercetin dioxygenase-like cupin family protein
MAATKPLAPVMLCTGKGENLWFFGGLLTFKATAEQTGGGVVVAEQLFRCGMTTPLHVQPREATSFYVLDGRLTFTVGATTKHAHDGAFVHVPAGVPHAFRVESETVRLLNITTPEHEQFFRVAGVPAPAPMLPPPGDPPGTVDLDRVAAAAARFGVEIVGPSPFGERPDPLGPAAVPQYDITR